VYGHLKWLSLHLQNDPMHSAFVLEHASGIIQGASRSTSEMFAIKIKLLVIMDKFKAAVYQMLKNKK